MSEITPDHLHDQLQADSEDPVVVDIRNEEEFEEWHIPGSKNIAVYDELQTDPETAAAALSAIPEDKEVVTVCAAGVLSQKATQLLREMGYDAKTLTDGMNGWSRVHVSHRVESDIHGKIIQVVRPGKGCLSHILVSHGEAAVYDPSQYTAEYDAILAEHGAELIGVFDTHAHADHVSGGRKLADRHDVPYHLHSADADNRDAVPLSDGDIFGVGAVEVTAIHTPGHSPGSVTFAVEDEALLTGDTLFHGSVGRVELGVEAGLEDTDVESNAERLYESLQRLQQLDGDPVVLPAHDSGTPKPPVAAQLSRVRRTNDDLEREREAFVTELSSDLPEHPPNFQRVKRVNTGIEQVPNEELSDLESGPNRCAVE